MAMRRCSPVDSSSAPCQPLGEKAERAVAERDIDLPLLEAIRKVWIGGDAAQGPIGQVGPLRQGQTLEVLGSADGAAANAPDVSKGPVERAPPGARRDPDEQRLTGPDRAVLGTAE